MNIDLGMEDKKSVLRRYFRNILVPNLPLRP